MDDQPPPQPTPQGDRSVGRQLSLALVTFGATMLLLAGLNAILGGAGAADRAPRAGPRTSVTASSSDASAVGPPATATRPSPPPTTTPTTAPTPTAAPTQRPEPVLVGAGDIADCDSRGDEATAALLDDIDGTVFTAGDNVYESATEAAFRDCYEPSWGRHLARTRPAAGNHDWASGTIRAYLDYFGARAAGPEGETWYAYELGAWRIIVLDSDCGAVGGCDPDSAQGRWLAETLSGSDARCTLAVWHHPRFSSGYHGNDAGVAPFWKALYEAGADVIINGHDHDYERFAPQDPSGTEDRARGLREFVVGTGGRALRRFYDIQPNSELRASLDHGVLALTLHEGSYSWQFHAATTDFSDRGTARCH